LRCTALSLAAAAGLLACKADGGSDPPLGGEDAASASDDGGTAADAGGGTISGGDGGASAGSGPGSGIEAEGGMQDASPADGSSVGTDATSPDPQPDAGRDAGSASTSPQLCLADGSAVQSAASGACDDPIVVDLSGAELGDVFVHESPSLATDGPVIGLDKCAESTERDVVYQVQLPDEADLELAVQASGGADPILLVQDALDPTCGTAITLACVDDYAEDECEELRVNVSRGGFADDTVQLVIAETEASGRALSVRFRVADPGGGS
jgi:hypothetical protein